MSSLDTAKQILLTPTGISELELEKVLSQALGGAIDSADLYFQTSQFESWAIEDSIIKEGSYSIEKGVGVRALSAEKAGFAYTEDIVLPALEQAAKAAKCIATSSGNKAIKTWQQSLTPHSLYAQHNPLQSISDQQKIALLQQIDQVARKHDPRVSKVIASLTGCHEVVLIAASDGTLAADFRPLVRLNINVIANSRGRIEQANAGGGGRESYQIFLDDNYALASQYAIEAVEQALLNLSAKPAPAGVMPVVLGPGWPGVLLHEAIGHGLEGDFNRKQSSAFAGKLGSQVASAACTIVDDGTLASKRGSLNIDDEGTPSQCTTLIENGILKNYLQDKLNAKLMGMQATGNGRRESYAYLPMPRMTNTYMLPGKHAPEEIIASVDKGIYATNFGGGQVDITSGKFVFNTSQAYLIENGKITTPIKGATLIGNGPDILTKVSMVGNDLKLDPGVGTCGKDGQNVAVGVGQPTMLVEQLTVGGTKG